MVCGKSISDPSPWLFLLIIFNSPVYWTGEAQIVLQNQCKALISVCSNDASRPITLLPNNATSVPAPTGAATLSFWACNSDDCKCIDTENLNATVARFSSIYSDSISYWLSAEDGYNFAIKIMPLGPITSCPTITCAANLDKCPHELQICQSSNTVVACRPPDCSDPAQLLCSAYSSLVADSQCQIPGSSYDPSSISSTCPTSIDLVASFICN